MCFKKTTEIEKLKSKFKGTNSRTNILEAEIKTIKTEFENSRFLLMQKSENDDSYITALKSEIKKAKMELKKYEDESQAFKLAQNTLKKMNETFENEKVN